METFGIKSTKYFDTKIKYGSFLMDFNKKGIAEVEVKDENEKNELDNLTKDFDEICYLEDSDNKIIEAEKQKNVEYLKDIIKGKDEEIKVLNISNQDLSSENIRLKAEIKALKLVKSISNDSAINLNDEQNVNENVDGDNKDSQEDDTKNDLNKKTVAELKDILSDVFKDYESEWKSLTKKDDIINYIITKSDEK